MRDGLTEFKIDRYGHLGAAFTAENGLTLDPDIVLAQDFQMIFLFDA